jgi:hypothetical protein
VYVLSLLYGVFLSRIREKKGEPTCNIEDQPTWDTTYFEQTREERITMILDADRKHPVDSNNMN